MPVEVNNWGSASLIVFGYLAAAFWQNKRFDDMKDWFKAEIGRVEGELKAELKRVDGVLSAKLDGLTVRVKALEAQRAPRAEKQVRYSRGLDVPALRVYLGRRDSFAASEAPTFKS